MNTGRIAANAGLVLGHSGSNCNLGIVLNISFRDGRFSAGSRARRLASNQPLARDWRSILSSQCSLAGGGRWHIIMGCVGNGL